MNQPWPKATNLYTAVLKIQAMFSYYLDYTIDDFPEEEQESAREEYQEGIHLCEKYLIAQTDIEQLLQCLGRNSLKWYIIFLEDFLPKNLMYLVPDE